MSDKPGNPHGKPPGKPPVPASDQEPGRLEQDDRGNVTWQWSDNDDLLADDTLGAAERVRALLDPSLDIVDDQAPHELKDNPKGLKVGYNPYDSGSLGKQSWKKKKNLRELSKWIELKKKMANKPSEK
jgi:hypothetical protein